jgi:hypothetical protein
MDHVGAIRRRRRRAAHHRLGSPRLQRASGQGGFSRGLRRAAPVTPMCAAGSPSTYGLTRLVCMCIVVDYESMNSPASAFACPAGTRRRQRFVGRREGGANSGECGQYGIWPIGPALGALCPCIADAARQRGRSNDPMTRRTARFAGAVRAVARQLGARAPDHRSVPSSGERPVGTHRMSAQWSDDMNLLRQDTSNVGPVEQ